MYLPGICRRWLCFWLILPTLVLAFVFSSSQVAAADFSSQVVTTYEVDNSGQTKVSHDFVLTNLTPTLYVKQYAIQLQQTGLTEIQAQIAGETSKPHVTETKNNTNIALEFSDQVVGQGNQRHFSITYQSPQIAVINGQVLEVRIPQTAQAESESSHQVVLKTPLTFGQPYRVMPKADKTAIKGNQVVQTFDSTQGQAILAIFGKEQVYQLDLRYHLDNPLGSPVMTQIALPPSAAYQSLIYQVLEPRPMRIEEDPDGNWLAEYNLAANQKLTVNASALAKISLDPNPQFQPVEPSPNHTASQLYWETKSPTVKQLAANQQNPAQLYQTVIDTLNYTKADLTQATERLGAEKSLSQPEDAVCQEFTDLFVTLARSQQIPARRLTGYAATNDQTIRPTALLGDVLHAWADYYDYQSGSWHQVDPTWEDTTGGLDYFSQFDLNHIVFAINGASSTLPYAVGSYKSESEATSQDVVVNLANQFQLLDPQIEVKWLPTKLGKLTLPGVYTLEVTNQNGQGWYNLQGKFISDQSAQFIPNNFVWRSLLPFQTKQLKFFATNPGLLPTRTPLHLQLKLGGETETLEFEETSISAAPAIFKSANQFILILAVGGASIIVTLGAGSLLVYRQRKAGALRRQSQKPKKTAGSLPPATATSQEVANSSSAGSSPQTPSLSQ